MNIPDFHNASPVDLWVFRLDSLPAGDRRARERALLRAVLASRMNTGAERIEIEVAEGGKPRADGCEFSISHSGPWLAIATGDVEIGVDIEVKKRPADALALARRFFSGADFALLNAADATERDGIFIRQWVAKEAALKCEGVGLARHLHAAECVMRSEAIFAVRCGGMHYSIREFALPDGTPGAVAWKGDARREIRRRDAEEIAVS